MNYQEFIAEVNKHRDSKLLYQYGERNKPENYLPKDPVKGKKLARSASPQVAQIVPTSKNNQIPFKHTTYGIDMTNREEGLKKKVRTMERLGILHGGTRAKDLD
jgi:hypothetical protein